MHSSTLAVALPLDLATELLGEAVDEAAAEPGIGPSRIEALASEPHAPSERGLILPLAGEAASISLGL